MRRQADQPRLGSLHIGPDRGNGVIHGDEDNGQKHHVGDDDQHDQYTPPLQRHDLFDPTQRLLGRHGPYARVVRR